MLPPSEGSIDIFLQPGELYFGDRHTRIRTLLGSCVSITLWNPWLKIGGMCHFMLPTRGHVGPHLDGRYGDEALALLLREIRASRSRPGDYEVKLFGGGNMFPEHCSRHDNLSVPKRNVESARRMLKAHGLVIHAEHVGGSGHRQLIFDVGNGHVWLRHRALGHEQERDNA